MFNDPVFWTLVAFVIFIGLIGKNVYIMVTKGLDDRSDKIRRDIDGAEKLRLEAQDLLAAYQKKQRDAAKATEDIMAQARHEAERLTAQGREHLEHSLARRKQLATDRITQAETEAIEHIRNLAVDVALDAAQTVIADTLPATRAEAMIDAAIGELEGNFG